MFFMGTGGVLGVAALAGGGWMLLTKRRSKRDAPVGPRRPHKPERSKGGRKRGWGKGVFGGEKAEAEEVEEEEGVDGGVKAFSTRNPLTVRR